MGKHKQAPQDEPEHEPTEEARQAAEEYASDQRGIIRRLLEILKPDKRAH